jgi:hypothetical protein
MPNLVAEGTHESSLAAPQSAPAAPPPAALDISSKRLTCKDPDLIGPDVLPSRRNAEADKWGDITVAQPKIWQFERVNALLDGLLRDVEGVSLGDLTQLDPSQQNGAALRFVQSALEVGVQYDQAAALNAADTLSSYNALHASQIQQLNQYNTYMQTLTGERDRLAAQYSAASNEVNALQALSAAGTLTDAQQKQLAEAQSRQTNTQNSLTSINTLISGAGAAPTITPPPTVTGTSVQGPASGSTMSSSLSGFADVLKNLPQGVQNNLSTALQSPSYPATKRLDNFITLLYERLAREVSVLQDDLTRDPENVAFLVQFDVGLYPSKKSKDHVARVEFNLDCPGCKVYSLYPGQSSYNLANYSGASKRNSFWGNILTLIGLGISASYRRQTDTLQGSLVQSVYTAGFQNGVLYDSPRGEKQQRVDANQAEQSFGWYYGAAPFEQQVSPGIRSTFALITVPRKLIERTEDRFGNPDACMPFHIDAGWANRNDPLAQDTYVSPVGRYAKLGRTPAYLPRRHRLIPEAGATGASPYDPSVLTMQTSVKLPAFADSYPLIAKREHKLHVLSLEYNTVTEPPEQPANAATVQTSVQSNTQSTNPATGQSTNQTTTQTTGTTVAVSGSPASPAAGNSVNTPSNLDLLPCPEHKCAALVIKLDRPIDPNLVVTVRGQPLTRVRDWRGRATSVLPAAQSGTDLPATATSAGSLALKQLQQSRGLLESDQFAPNTWFQLNSRELLLNVSVNVASDEEFPVIQLGDPSGSVVIPHDLRRGFTELIINGFRFKSLTEHGIQQETGRQNWRDTSDCPDENEKDCPAKCLANCPDCPTDCRSQPHDKPDAPISAGPYAFSTFLPLFSPVPAPRRFFAAVGETGDDLLIGFLPNRDPQETDKTRYNWREAQTQVVLEDRDLDFAWSLSCDVQGELLACRMPREEISRSYRNFLLACPDADTCPGQSLERLSLMQSLERKMDAMFGPLKTDNGSKQSATNSDVEMTDEARAAALQAKRQENARRREKLFLTRDDLRDLEEAFVSTMQVWIWQADEEGKNTFYSVEPARIGFLPLSNDYWNDTQFKPWEFLGATANSIKIGECNYWTQSAQCNASVSLLGVRSWPNWLKQWHSSCRVDDRPNWVSLENEGNPKCGSFELPTAALANDPVVFEMEFPPHPSAPKTLPGGCISACSAAVENLQAQETHGLRTTIAMPKPRLAPTFKTPEIEPYKTTAPPQEGKPAVEERGWTIRIPVLNSACGDEIQLSKDAKVDLEWRNGEEEFSKEFSTQISKEFLKDLRPCLPASYGNKEIAPKFDAWTKVNAAWQNADQSDRVRLYLKVPRAAINDLPDRLPVVRTTSDGVRWVVGALPNLKSLILPSKVALTSLGPTQFALMGKNAGTIDAVSLQGVDGSSTTLTAAPGVDLAVVTLPSPAATPASDSASTNSTGTSSSTQITIDTTKDNTDHVKMTTQNSSTPVKSGTSEKPSTSQSSDTNANSPKQLAAGSYAVIPLIQVGLTAGASNLPALKAKAASANDDLAKKTKTEQDAATAAKNDPSDKNKQAAKKATSDRKNAQAAATKAANDLKNGKPTPLYLPLKVTDDKGKPLTFTVPDTKKANTTTPSNLATTTTCSVPCIATPCTAACPQATTVASPSSNK